MPTYILLLSLTPEGRHRMLYDPDRLLVAEQEIDLPNTGVHGLYAVLGEYDFVSILDAPDNASAARFSMELGVSAGVQVTTLPAIPIGRLQQALGSINPEADLAGVAGPDDEEFRDGH